MKSKSQIHIPQLLAISHLFAVSLALLGSLILFSGPAMAQTSSDAQLEDALFQSLASKFVKIRKSGFPTVSDQALTTLQRDPADHTRAFDPDSGRNFAWDATKKAWIDTKTLECICPKCPPLSTVKPPPATPTPTPEKTSSSEEYAKAFEFFGGYQYQRASDEPVKNRHGFDASLFYRVTPHISMVGDFNSLWGSTSETVGTSTFPISVSRQSYLFGPQNTVYEAQFHQSDPVLRSRLGVVLKVHALFGIVHDTVKFDFGTTSTDSSATAFAMALGGGLDVRVTPRVSIRVFQADYIQTHFGGERQKISASRPDLSLDLAAASSPRTPSNNLVNL